MKVLHVVEATTAGVGRHVLDLALNMQRAGLEVRVACPPVRENARQDTGFVSRLLAGGVPVSLVVMQRSISLKGDLRAGLDLARLIRQETPDILHTHSSKAGVLARVAALRAPARPVVVYTPNAFAFLGDRRALTRWAFRQVERWLGRLATDALICVSRSELELARQERIVPDDRLALVENAIDAQRFQDIGSLSFSRTELGLDPGRPLVGYIGRLVEQKGLTDLLRSARLLKDAAVEAQFVLVGEGGMESALRRLADEIGLADNVVFLGYRDDVPRILGALDVFVLPSRYEGLPYTLMEAMAAGCPVVATDVIGSRDLVQSGETGLMVPPGDPQAFAAAIITLLNDPEKRKRLGQAAAAAILARPTPQEMAQRVVELYRTLLDQWVENRR